MRSLWTACLVLLLCGCANPSVELPTTMASTTWTAPTTSASVSTAPPQPQAPPPPAISWRVDADGNASVAALWRFETAFSCVLTANTTVRLEPYAKHLHLLEVYADGNLTYVGDLSWAAGRSFHGHAGPVGTGPAHDAVTAAAAQAMGVKGNLSQSNVTFTVAGEAPPPGRAYDVVYTVGGDALDSSSDAALRIWADCDVGAPSWQVARTHSLWITGDPGAAAGARVGTNFADATVLLDFAHHAVGPARLVAVQMEGGASLEAAWPGGGESWTLGALRRLAAQQAGPGTYTVQGSAAGADLLVLVQDLQDAASPAELVQGFPGPV